MLKTCEDYAMKHNILFNAKKSQMLTFDHRFRISVKPILKMRNGENIPYVTKCNHLGNILSTISDFPIVDHAVNDLYMRTNCLFADFSFMDSNTLSRLFNTYCTNIYGGPLWKILIENCWNHSILPGKNVLEEFGKFLILHIMF